MRGKKAKIILSVLIFTAIPSFLSYVSNSDYFFTKLIGAGILSENITKSIDLIQDGCLIASIVLSVILLSVTSAKAQIKHELMLEQRNLLIKMNKDNLKTALVEKFSKEFSNFNIRIFIPKHPRWYALLKWLHVRNHKVSFIIKNIPQIAEAGITTNLEFEVYPKCEGLVGLCYEKKVMYYDDNLTENNSTSYNLGDNQIARTSNLEWSICCPVFESANDVIAIIALDGTEKLTIDKSREVELSKQIVVFSRMLYDAVPQLFRR